MENITDKHICGSHILIDDKIAKSTLKSIKNGSVSFGNVALTQSKCPSGRNNPKLNACRLILDKNDLNYKAKELECVEKFAGNLGCFLPEEMVPEFSEKLKKIDKGQLDIVKTQFGTHIIKRD